MLQFGLDDARQTNSEKVKTNKIETHDCCYDKVPPL